MNKIHHVFIGIVIVVISLSCKNVYSQLYLSSLGDLGIGTNNPTQKVEIDGNGLMLFGNNNHFRFLTNNPGTEIGTSYGGINFWYSTNNWNTLYAAHFVTSSDSTLKDSITQITDAYSILKNLEGKSFYFKNDSTVRKQYGFIAQQVNNYLPGIVFKQKGNLLMDYNQIIPFLVEVVKSQQNKIDSINIALVNQQNTIDSLISDVKLYEGRILDLLNNCCADNSLKSQSNNSTPQHLLNIGKDSIIYSDNQPKLYQNTPNPFNRKTEIKYYMPSYCKNGSIIIHSLNGIEIKQVNLNSNGYGAILIDASEFQSGTYVYTLLMDGTAVDSKLMVLINE